MVKIRSTLPLMTLLLFMALGHMLSFAQAQTQNDHYILGEVLDINNNPISGAVVKGYRGVQLVSDPVETKKDGKYVIRFSAGEAIDTVTYEHSGYTPGDIEDLSGKRNHTIHKTLHFQGANLNFFEAQEVLAALERLHEIHRLQEQLEKIRKTYQPVIEKLAVPPELRGRLREVRAIYGLP